MVLQAATSNPVVAGAINWINFFRDMFRKFEFDNIDELLATQDEYQQMKEIAAQAQGTPLARLGGQPRNAASEGQLSASPMEPAMAGAA